MTISRAYLLAIAPGANPTIIDGIIASQALLPEYGIASEVAEDAFFGQVAEETGGFTRLEENLYYTSTARLRQVWPKRFLNDAAAAPYVRNPQKLANLVYAGRMGNTRPNDGWLYRGSALLQTTGHDNFMAVDRANPTIGALSYPDKLRSFPAALEAACIFWRDNHLNNFVVTNDIVGLTKRLNGGTTNLAERIRYTDRARAARHALPAVPAATMLRLGDHGDAVEKIQKLLVANGFYKDGRLDGNFGEGTDDAVRHFQASRGLVADGVVGDATMKALKASAADAMQNPPADPHTIIPAVSSDLRKGQAGLGLDDLFRAVLAVILAAFGRKG